MTKALYHHDMVPVLAYQKHVFEGQLSFDETQEEALRLLQSSYQKYQDDNSSWWRRFRSGKSSDQIKNERISPYGVYLYGDVGRGKSMMMDLFFNALATARKRRFHCHAFMDALHHMLHKKNEEKQTFNRVVQEVIQDAHVICFDELHIRDIADATLLQRVFNYFLENKIFFVCTSNVTPNGLYKDGLKREYFIDFFAHLDQMLAVIDVDIEKDYRREHAVDEARGKELVDQLLSLQHEGVVHDIKGRDLFLYPLDEGKIAIAFEELCVKARGFDDFVHLASCYDIVVMKDLPAMLGDHMLNETRRFITFVDIMYDAGATLLIDHSLYLYEGEKLSFEFERTTSRLHEMLLNMTNKEDV